MGFQIKKLREKNNMTQDELSALSGVSRATICALEKGTERATTTKTLMNLARALGVPVEALFFTESV